MDQQICFARLEGFIGAHEKSNKFFSTNIHELPTILGRSSADNCISIDSNDTTISRQHIEIGWNISNNNFTLTCLSKNCCVVNQKRIEKDQTIILNSGAAIRVGTAKFYFLESLSLNVNIKGISPSSSSKKRKSNEMESQIVNNTSLDSIKLSYQNMVESAFDSLCSNISSDNEGISQRDLVDWIVNKYPDSVSGIQKTSVNKGVYNALNKYFEKVININESEDKKGTTKWKTKN
jgi:pSer/pThr/pTyr-binding forkhead associated (FHA) protein